MAFSDGPQPSFGEVGYILNMGSSLDGERPFNKLSTMDVPPGVKAHAVGGSGLYVLGSDGVYWLPMPDSKGEDVYARAAKYCYEWKSKKFSFPGQMAMAAAKVIHDCAGFVRIRIYVDCCCAYETVVRDCKPFLLPPHLVGQEWEVELQGTSTVYKVHLASSLRELLEHD